MENQNVRPLLLFTNAIKSVQTKKQYMFSLRKFLCWSGIDNINDLVKKTELEIQTLLEDYLFYLKERISPNSLNPQFAALDLFFTLNDKTLNFKKIRKMFPAKVKKSGRDYWTTEQIAEMLKNAHNQRSRVLIQFLASTGCRVGAIPGLKQRHVKDYKDDCKVVTFYEDTMEEYLGFLTPEASRELDSYLRQRRIDGEFLTENSPLFRDTYRIGSSKARHVSADAIQNVMKRVTRYSNRERIGRRYNAQTNHGFRKRFDTILKSNDSANPSLVERLMGHGGVFELDGSYFRPKVEVLFNEFTKHVLNLTIDDSKRKSIKLSQLEIEKSELYKSRNEIDEMRKKRIEENEFGALARYAAFTKSLFERMAKGDLEVQALTIIFYLFLELRAPEKQKREIWKRLQQAKENGEEFDISWLGESNGLYLTNRASSVG